LLEFKREYIDKKEKREEAEEIEISQEAALSEKNKEMLEK